MKLGCQARSFGLGVYPDENAFLAVVAQVGSLGFAGLETNWKNLARYFEQPAAFQRELAGAGLELIGAHYGGKLWDPSARDQMVGDLARVAPFVAGLGGGCVVCSCPRPAGDALPEDTWARMADRLGEMAAAASEHGVRVAYHNHWWESEEEGLARLAELTDPAQVSFAFDTGHHTRAGADAPQMVRDLADRLAVVHLADFSPDAPAAGGHRPRLGDGELDVEAVRGALVEVGFDGWVVLEEQTDPATAREHVAGCMALLRGFCA